MTRLPHDPLSDALQQVLLAHTRAQAHLARTLGVSRADVDALEHLMSGPLSAVELARRLGLTQGAITHLLGRMEARDHARRTVDRDDRRRVAVEITETGRATVLEHVLPMLRELDALASDFDDDGSNAVLAYLAGSAVALVRLTNGGSRPDRGPGSPPHREPRDP